MQAHPNNLSAPSAAEDSAAFVSSSLDDTLSSLTANKNVLGYLLLTRSSEPGPVGIIRMSGAIFDGDKGKKYASVVSRMVQAVQGGLDDVQVEDEHDDLRFLRIRTRRYEIMITPSANHILAVVHDPGSS